MSGFWRGRRVLVTGHTGFKGAWASLWLTQLGAEVTGLALHPETPSIIALTGGAGNSIICDLRDRSAVARYVAEASPELVLHMAAQPLVRRSYREPVETFATNVMGTAHLLDALGPIDDVRAVLIVTSDKVYDNDEAGRAFVEADRLGGHDPYAASKAAAEILAASWRRSFLAERRVRLSTARGGNVIGGGDFSEDRLVPDIVRAFRAGTPLQLRNPGATRPWQHVLDCLSGYFSFLEAMATGRDAPDSLNFGPHDPSDVMTVATVSDEMTRALGGAPQWEQDHGPSPHEMAALSIDSRVARKVLGWQGRLDARTAIRWTADWYGAWANGADMRRVTLDQIAAYSEQEAPA